MNGKRCAMKITLLVNVVLLVTGVSLFIKMRRDQIASERLSDTFVVQLAQKLNLLSDVAHMKQNGEMKKMLSKEVEYDMDAMLEMLSEHPSFPGILARFDRVSTESAVTKSDGLKRAIEKWRHSEQFTEKNLPLLLYSTE